MKFKKFERHNYALRYACVLRVRRAVKTTTR